MAAPEARTLLASDAEAETELQLKSKQNDPEVVLNVNIDKDRLFWEWYHRSLLLGGYANFLTMPVMYFLGRMNLMVYGYCCVAVKFMASAIFQRWMLHTVIDWLQEKKQESGGGVSEVNGVKRTQKERVEPYAAVLEEEVRADCRCSLGCNTELIALVASQFTGAADLFLGLMEAVDPDLDSAAAGYSGSMLSAQQARCFAEAWESVPLIGSVI
eukprot:TRINITY_DN92691_c0_g1_i1.p1 TRINITY_DN92691_c0_g1~~TRINITY_DN92691_c0_g1_i1.p1  ORF type:complete len:214 (+),score=28.77 TRINITY_DN92691_c0_g1_i1:123-764(+)